MAKSKRFVPKNVWSMTIHFKKKTEKERSKNFCLDVILFSNNRKIVSSGN